MRFPESYLNSSVSCGTLCPQDLILTFLDVLRDVYPTAYAQMMVSSFGPVPSYAMEDMSSNWWNGDDAYFLLDELFDLLDSCSPEGFHFGSLEGDASDFGFWSCDEEV